MRTARGVSRRTFVGALAVSAAGLMTGGFVGCSQGASSSDAADVVVYGSIYTSNQSGDVVEAFAVKDGKYVFVGTEDGARAYVGNSTKIIEHADGTVMAGGTEGHGHYIQKHMKAFLLSTDAGNLNQLKAELKDYVASNPDINSYIAPGFKRTEDLAPNADIDYCAELDEVCADKPILCIDCDGHQGICNTIAMQQVFEPMGVRLRDSSKPSYDNESFEGGVILRLSDGKANGYLRDTACQYPAAVLGPNAFTDEQYELVVQNLQDDLHQLGYVYYNDAYTNYFGDKIFDALASADGRDALKVVFQPRFALLGADLSTDQGIEGAVNDVAKYQTDNAKHLLPAGIKVFMDGVTESQTANNSIPYAGTGSCGNDSTTEERIYKITKYANAKSISVHSHAFGDMAVHQATNGYIKAQEEVNNGTLNSLGHARNVLDEDYIRIAENNIGVALNINWRVPFTKDILTGYMQTVGVAEDIALNGYNLRTLLEAGVPVCSSTDAPADNGFPSNVFGIMENAVDAHTVAWIQGVGEANLALCGFQGVTEESILGKDVLNEDQYIEVKQAIDVFTINGAKLLGIQGERGSIEVGKYADFMLTDKDLFACDPCKIHETGIVALYFEGEEVYSA